MTRPTINEVENFISKDLGIVLKDGTWYELVPVEGEKGFEFYMVAIFNRIIDENGWATEDVSLSAYWPS